MTKATTHVLVVLVNYYCAEQTTGVLQQLEQLTKPDHIRLSVMCADNSHSDARRLSKNQQEQQKLTAFKQQSTLELTLIFHAQNLGFGRAINAATENAEFDFLWLLNPDITLTEQTFNALLNAAETNVDAGIWGGFTLSPHSGQPDYRHAWREPNLLNTGAWALGLHKFNQRTCWQNNYKHHKHDHACYPVDSISGCCMFISRAAWQASDGFDRDFFLYSEELDLCHRARTLGFQPTVITQAILFHSEDGTNNNAQRLLFLHYAKLLYASKHHGMLYNLCYRAQIALGAGIRAMTFALKNNTKMAQQWKAILVQALCCSAESVKQHYTHYYGSQEP